MRSSLRNFLPSDRVNKNMVGNGKAWWHVMWDSHARRTASEAEIDAAAIIWKIREDERLRLFGNLAYEALPGPETLEMGDSFITNLHRTRISKVWHIAKRTPKGCVLSAGFHSLLSTQTFFSHWDEMQNSHVCTS
jgi:adenosine deaminase CECR1